MADKIEGWTHTYKERTSAESLSRDAGDGHGQGDDVDDCFHYLNVVLEDQQMYIVSRRCQPFRRCEFPTTKSRMQKTGPNLMRSRVCIERRFSGVLLNQPEPQKVNVYFYARYLFLRERST